MLFHKAKASLLVSCWLSYCALC